MLYIYSQFLCLVDTKITDAQLAASFIELTPEDVDHYQALRNGQKELTAMIKNEAAGAKISI